MAEVPSLVKPPGIATCNELAEHFFNQLFNKYNASEEIRLFFDKYDVPMSLKTATRVQRQGKNEPVYCHITDSTHIAKVNTKRLLSHTKTKQELTVYLARSLLSLLRVTKVVSWGCECAATSQRTEQLQSNHEEADTKLILHAIDATAHGATEVNK